MADITSNLKLWYTLDEGTGTSCADSSGSGLTGTLSSSGWTTGRIGANCVSFANTRSISVGTSDVLNLSGKAITVALWAYPTAINNYYRIVERGESFGNGTTQFSYVLDSGTGKQRLDIDQAGTLTTILSGTGLTVNTWQHIAFTYDGSFLKMYLNGVADQSLSLTANVNSYSGLHTYIGRYTGGAGTYEFPGQLDDVRIYQRALALADVVALVAYTGKRLLRRRREAALA